MPKPCDTRTDLPCIYMGKCRGPVHFLGKPKPLFDLRQVIVCPCAEEVQGWVEKNGGRK
jgi:hypothetical protein